jgi:hypothetical protein
MNSSPTLVKVLEVCEEVSQYRIRLIYGLERELPGNAHPFFIGENYLKKDSREHRQGEGLVKWNYNIEKHYLDEKYCYLLTCGINEPVHKQVRKPREPQLADVFEFSPRQQAL